MTTKPFVKILSIAFTLLIFSANTAIASSQTPQDSIRKILPTLKGEARLQALMDIYTLVALGDDLEAELEAIGDMRAEAVRQKNLDANGQSRVKEIFSYYNYNALDSVLKYLPEHLEFMAQHEQWDNYYNIWEAKVELYLYADKTQTALKETQLMYDDAKERNNNYGLGVSAHSLGIIYQTLQRYDLAIKSFDEAVARLTKEEDISLLLNTYNTLSETLDADHQFERMLTVSEKWKATIDKYKVGAIARGITPQLNGRYLYCYLALTVAHFETGKTAKAEEYMRIAEQLAEGRGMISQFKLLHIKTRLYEHLGQYDKAIACAEKNYQDVISFGDSVSALTVLENKARILLKAGKGIEAAHLYKYVMAEKDSLRNLDMAAQLDELRTVYEVDQLMLEKKVSNSRLVISSIIIAFLVLILVGYMAYSQQVNRKNKILYQKIRSAQQAESQADELIEQAPKKTQSKEQLLFRELNNMFREKLSFTDPKLDRKELADLLGTNATYLATAIKDCSEGLTVSEYINKIRLLYAGNLLVESSQVSIDAVGENAGFNSRSTYYRLFRDYYGMSPAEFRNISQQKSKK